MKRINATFSDEIVEKIKKYKAVEGLTTFAECVNQLVELGLKKSAKNISETRDFSYESSVKISRELAEILAVKKLLTDNLDWTMENRLLNRYLVANMPNQSKEMSIEILKKIKEKAQILVKKMLPSHLSSLSDSPL